MPKEERYQGWTNYATWGVALILDNDEGTHFFLRNRATELREEAPDREETYWSEEEYVKFNLADEIKEMVEEAVERATESGSTFDQLMTSQLMQSALGDVEWHEVAGSFMEE